MTDYPLPHAELFWSHVDHTTTPDGCWLWTGATDKNGYGVLVHHGIHWRAHRATWALTHGPLPSSVHLLHGCDTPACCRPDSPAHLRPGTPADNAADRLARHRTPCSPVNDSRPPVSSFSRSNRAHRIEVHRSKVLCTSMSSSKGRAQSLMMTTSGAHRPGPDPGS